MHATPHRTPSMVAFHDVASQAFARSVLREVRLQALNQVGDDRGAMSRSV